MDSDFVSLDPTDLSISATYDLLVNAVQPRPIAFISSMNAAGDLNLAPFSFFTVGGANPPSVAYSPTLNKEGGKKDSLRYVEETGEFVVNTLVRSMGEGMNATSYEYAIGVSEWDICGFTPIPSDIVKPPRVLESPVQFECKLFQVVQHGSGPSAACYVIGEIVKFHVSRSVWTGGGIDPESFRPISRMGGPQYLDTKTLELFSIVRPTKPADSSLEP